MPISLHSHSGSYCMHATGTLREVVEAAITKGFLVYGLSEHMPRYRTQDLYPEESHLKPADLETLFHEFSIEAKSLQVEYADRIKLLVGMETEFITRATPNHPAFDHSQITHLRDTYQLDYIVGSVHHVNGMMIDYGREEFEFAVRELSSGRDCNDAYNALFHTYFNHQFTLLKHIQPEVVGHFDLCRMFCPDAVLDAQSWTLVLRNIDYIHAYGGIVEINSRAWKKGLSDAYPFRDILKIMIDKNVRFTISDDSHGPLEVGMHYDKLYAYLIEMGISRVYYPGDGCIDLCNHPFFTRNLL